MIKACSVTEEPSTDSSFRDTRANAQRNSRQSPDPVTMEPTGIRSPCYFLRTLFHSMSRIILLSVSMAKDQHHKVPPWYRLVKGVCKEKAKFYNLYGRILLIRPAPYCWCLISSNPIGFEVCGLRSVFFLLARCQNPK